MFTAVFLFLNTLFFLIFNEPAHSYWWTVLFIAIDIWVDKNSEAN